MITVNLDSVGGQKCLVVYRDGTPVSTIWNWRGTGYNPEQMWTFTGKWVHPAWADELASLLHTMTLMCATETDIVRAVETFLNEKEP